ncbi:MAG TPA: alpha/beta hydrolase, partial [Desulfobaccales bacterium]|nr:alpha/beta hydrolase [Desulfobaccales bacterium]
MTDFSFDDYAPLDAPEVLLRLFHPRPEAGGGSTDPAARDLLIPAADKVLVGARFYPAAAAAPTILFFHGN